MKENFNKFESFSCNNDCGKNLVRSADSRASGSFLPPRTAILRSVSLNFSDSTVFISSVMVRGLYVLPPSSVGFSPAIRHSIWLLCYVLASFSEFRIE
ncbi:hypothetical protein I3842_02G019300 [Carya illinoinensis]|uniref:Uncharacterized protein n=1 Tax=Carya illinoinensis TaxID=32201 RepID=A0A922K1H5_CARIL|nr:hypothetical protein I3842_02G019300 [Carya illinoinensis]